MDESNSKTQQRCRTGNTVASFLLKTFQILEHPDYEHIISWTADNVSFLIKNVQQFSKEILPRYFRHGNFSSFVRQLNMYDFHKVKQDKDSIAFRNELFTRNGQALLKQIKRKAPKTKKSDQQEISCVGSSRKRHLRSAGSNPRASSQFKKVIEAEVNYSSYLFEKAIKQLERPLNFKNPSSELIDHLDNSNWYASSEEEKINPSHPTKNMIDILYDVKSKCYSFFTAYESMLREIDSGYQQKLASLESSQPNSIATQQSTEQENKPVPKVKSPLPQQSMGFKPCSTHTLSHKFSMMQETKIASTPELNQA